MSDDATTAPAPEEPPPATARPRGRPRINPDTCTVPHCARKAITRGLCHGHVVQFYRRGDILGLTPLRHRGGRGVRLPGVFVGEEVRDRLLERGPTVYLAARRVLEEWAFAQEPDPNPPPLVDPEP